MGPLYVHHFEIVETAEELNVNQLFSLSIITCIVC